MNTNNTSLDKVNRYLLVAVLIGLLVHGTSMFFTLEKTYDALIHLFFADHYASSWFEPWNPKWYTGFSVMGYPPLVHQCIALLSGIGGLKFGLYAMATISILLFITGVYRFSLLLTGDKSVAGYASLFAAVSSSFAETLHVFGQLPSIIGISLLLHALPYIYGWLRTSHKLDFIKSLSLISVTVASHHVTPIFGMVFFIFPVIGMAILDDAKMRVGIHNRVRFKQFLSSFLNLFWRIISFGFCSLFLIIFVILPYWINSKNNPITQVPIPHGSRDSFIDVLSSGFIFFAVPYGVLLFLLPYCFYRYFSKRYLFFGISLTILFVLGTGGTTPIPRMLLGDTAFNILTLDRFTLWASILVLPLIGEFIHRFIEGDFRTYLITKFGKAYYYGVASQYGGFVCLLLILTLSLFKFRPSQPATIQMQPIVNFLNQDDHDRWRYLTLGFGDQMAWLSTQTNALSVDGNYHSARRLPELTTRAVERLENSKFLGVEGLGSLQQFLTVPDKYNLRYIFSNDKFYDPILYFAGWKRLTQLENGINVWERLYVPPLPVVLKKDRISKWQMLHWGIVPVGVMLFGLFILILLPVIINRSWSNYTFNQQAHRNWHSSSPSILSMNLLHIWSYLLGFMILSSFLLFVYEKRPHSSPEKVLKAYYNALDFKEFDTAYALLDKSSAPEKADYMMAISVSDGVINSYAKLNNISINKLEVSNTHAQVSVDCQYITPLEVVDQTYTHTLRRIGGKWYIMHDPIDKDIPPQLYQAQTELQYHIHGRRRISSGKTYREDIIIQPIIETIEASLIKHDGQFSIIGEIQNLDNLPADVAITASLFTKNNKRIATYSTMYIQKHVLLPKESTPFRLEFEDTAWLDVASKKSETFDPNLKIPAALSDEPHHFELHITSNTTDVIPYQDIVLTELISEDDQLIGSLYNNGTQEVTIPQLLVGYYNVENQLMWLDHSFIQSNIRQQRKIGFTYNPIDYNHIEVIYSGTEFSYCNGKSNGRKSIYATDKHLFPFNEDLKLSIDVNNFIGNPK